jgi:hypothetical protein
MKRAGWFALSIMLLAASSNAQDNTARRTPNSAAEKPLVVSGRVSDDGRSLTTDIDSEWTVSNPATLKGYEGRLIQVKCYVNTAGSSIQILSVKRDNRSNYAAAHPSDSAFRR